MLNVDDFFIPLILVKFLFILKLRERKVGLGIKRD